MPLLISNGDDERKHSVTSDTRWFPRHHLSQTLESNDDLYGGTPLKIGFSLEFGLPNLHLGIAPINITEWESHATLQLSTRCSKAQWHWDESFSYDYIWKQSGWIELTDNSDLLWKIEFTKDDKSIYTSVRPPELFGLQAEGCHALVSLRRKTLRASGERSKNRLTSAEESGTDTRQETDAGLLLESVVTQTVLGRLKPSDGGNQCKFNIWGSFEVHLYLNECDRTWDDPCVKKLLYGDERSLKGQTLMTIAN